MMNTLIWYIENILKQMMQMLPAMAVALVVWSVVRPVRLYSLERSGLISPKRREFFLLAFVLFCAGLCALTLFPYGFWNEFFKMILEPGYEPQFSYPSWEESLCALRELPYSLTPFQEILRVNQGGPWLWFVLWGNIGMFAPVGFCLPLLWRKRKWYHAVLTGATFSLSIEVIQVFVGRVSDVDDLILNTVGALLGFLFYNLLCKVIPLDWKMFHCRNKEDA